MTCQTKSECRIQSFRRLSLVLLALVGTLPPSEVVSAQGSGGSGITAAPLLSQAVNLKTGQNGPSSVVLADVNGDGIPDMVVANQYGGGPNGDSLVSVFLGNGDGTFQPPVNYDSGGPNAVSVFVADVNADGYPDIFVLNQAGGANGDASVGVVTNDKNVNGTFNNAGQTPTTTYDAGGTDPNTNTQLNLINTVQVLTINGKPAIVVSNQLDPNSPIGDGSIGVLLQNGQGGFGPVTTFDSGGAGSNVLAIMDVNGDALPDLVVANSCYSASTCSTQQGGVAVLLNNGDGTFGPAVSYQTPGFALGVSVGDLNGDGIPDILVSSAGTGELINNGNGTFQSFVSLGNPGQTVSVAIRDVNGDGINDLVIGLYFCTTCDNGNDSGIAVALGNANSVNGKAAGTFGPWQTYDTAGQGVFGLAFGHLISGNNAAGTPDIVTANVCDVTDPYCGGNDSVFLNNNAAIALTSTLAGPAIPPLINTLASLTFTVNNPANLSLGPGTIFLYDGTTQLHSLSVPQVQGSSSFTLNWTPTIAGTHNLAAVYSASGRINSLGAAVAPESSTAFLQQNVVTPRTLVGITITPANPTTVSGATLQFDAMGSYSDGSTTDVTASAIWSSSSGAVAAINGSGFILGVGPGQANVSATLGAISGSTTITVTAPATVPVMAPVAYYSTASIGFSGASAGSTQTIALINAGENPLTLNSASITAGAANFSAALTTCPNNAASFPVTIPAGGTCVFTITYVDTTTVSGAITFTDNASLSNIPSSGSGSTFTQVIPINPAQAGDSFAPPEPVVDAETISVNDEVFITPLVSVAAPVAEYSFSTLGFSSQATQVLTVSNIGQQNLVLSSLTISGSAFALSAIACSTGATSITSLNLPPGGACSLTFSYTATNGPPSGFVTFVDNANLSNVTSVGAGSGSYTQAISLSGTANSNVPIPAALLAVSISPNLATVAPGATQQFTATGSFSDGTTGDVTRSVTWSSSSTNVATISNQAGTQGLATAISAGTANIAATSGSVTATAVLNVSLVDSELISVDDAVTVGTSPLITSPSSADFIVGTPGSFAVAAFGTPPPTITESGQLPKGVTFSSGALSGTPAAGSGGNYPITINASNSTNPSASQNFTLTVRQLQLPKITSAAKTTFTAGTSGTFTMTASGYPTPTFSETGALPSGVTMSAAGVLSGTPAPGTGGGYSISVTASNAAGTSSAQTFTLTVDQAPAITSAAAATFTTGTPGWFTLTATGYPAPTFTRTGTLPGGVTFTDATGVLSGTPGASAGGSYTLTFTATNPAGTSAAQSFTLTVNQLPKVSSAAKTTFTVGTAGTFTVTGTGYPSPTFSTTGALPSGVTLSAAGLLSGTPGPGTGGVYSIAVTATNAVGTSTAQTFTLTVDQAPAITSAAAATFTTGTAGSFTVMATGYPLPTFTKTGTLPGGMTFAAATGVLSGTPGASAGGSYPLTFTSTNSAGTSAQTFTLTVNQLPKVTSAAKTAFTTGTSGTFAMTASGYPAPTFSEIGALPGGVTFSAAGVLSGTPTAGAGGAYSISVTATNASGTSTAQTFTLTVDQAPAITSAASTTFTVGTAGTFTVTATGYPVPTFIRTGTLPGGVTFTSATGMLSGTPSKTGTYILTFTATNSVGTSAAETFTLTVN
jgi:hypothetical protein